MMAVGFRKELFTLTKKDIKGGAIVGTVLFIAFATQLVALQYTEAGKQAFLAGTYVVMVPFISWWLHKKKPDNSSFLGAFICFMGIGLLTLNESLTIGFGDSLTLFSSLFFAGHIISNGYFVDEIGPVKLTIVQFGTVALLSSVSAFVFEPFPSGVEANGIYAVLYLGVLCTGVAYFLQTIGQKYALSTHTAIILSLEAVFGSVLALFILGEVFTFKMVIGCLSILSAILIIELKGTKKEDSSISE
jgi:drug/metabolite transporter (DMT)-like permease